MSGLQLIATGGAIPGRTVTNEDLSRMVDTSDEWITSRTGIRTRHWCTEDESAATLAISAAKQALACGSATGILQSGNGSLPIPKLHGQPDINHPQPSPSSQASVHHQFPSIVPDRYYAFHHYKTMQYNRLQN